MAGQRRLIVHADDFGISPGVNRGILAASGCGVVTSASLMANLPAASDALDAWRAGGARLDLGLHFTLTAGRPVSPPDAVPSLVRPDGSFHGLAALLPRLALGRVRRTDLEREFAAQVEKALALGARLTHVDSHHHVHVHPAVARVLLELAPRYGITAIRCPVERPAGRIAGATRVALRDLLRTLLVSLAAARLRAELRARGLRTSDHFRGLALGYGADARQLAATLRSLPEGLSELMCHPGEPDEELRRWTVFVAGRERELAALCDESVRSALGDTKLVGWGDAVGWTPRA